MSRTRTRISAMALAGNVLAAALLTPVVVAAGFLLAVEGVATGSVFRLMMLADRFLPASPDLGAIELAAVAMGCLGVLVFACLKRSWLLPALLIVLGVSAESYFFGVVGLSGNGDTLIPVLGILGIILSGVQLRWAARQKWRGAA